MAPPARGRLSWTLGGESILRPHGPSAWTLPSMTRGRRRGGPNGAGSAGTRTAAQSHRPYPQAIRAAGPGGRHGHGRGNHLRSRGPVRRARCPARRDRQAAQAPASGTRAPLLRGPQRRRDRRATRLPARDGPRLRVASARRAPRGDAPAARQPDLVPGERNLMRTEDDLRSALRLPERETPSAETVLRRLTERTGAGRAGPARPPGRRLMAGAAAAAAVIAT